ncbi:MAG: DUF368 domain-containing protein [Planctomycetota bacterium]
MSTTSSLRLTTTTDPGEPATDRVGAPHALAGGVLMGLANLVPGISGGTMILALGLYDRFIGAVADVTRLRLRRDSILFLGTMAVGLVAAVLLLSGVAVQLVAEHRGAMYALFIGMTLGGAPELWRECRPLRPSVVLAIGIGLGAMAWFATQSGKAAIEPTTPTLMLVGAAGASSMILPGISGSYVLLILGMYDTVIGSLSLSEIRDDPAASASIILPVVAGAVLGIALLSNLLKALLRRFSAPAHGVLLGLLLGSVIGLYPFQEPVHPELAHRPTRKAIEAVVLDGEQPVAVASHVDGLSAIELEEHVNTWRGRSKGEIKQASLELRRFPPDFMRMRGAIALFVLGILATRLLGRRGG